MPPYWKSTISVCDTGAEVTLEEDEGYDCDHVIATPTKGGPIDYDPSLIENNKEDAENQSPLKAGALTCGMYGCLSSIDNTKSPLEIRRNDSFRLHGCILESLGNYDGRDWQEMLPSMADDLEDDENTAPSPHQMRVMHNRALHASSKTARLEKLRRDLHPFNRESSGAGAIRSSSTFSSPNLKQKNRSHQVESYDANVNNPEWGWSGCNPTQYNTYMSPKRLAEVDDDDCYDSDPECYQETRRWREPSRLPEGDHAADWNVDHNDERAMQDLIQTVFKERWTFILHPAYGTPVAIEGWLERGQRLQNATIAPKLIWLPLHEKSRKAQPKKMESELPGVDLLDIQRILQMNRVDRKKFALAKPRRTLMIKSIRGDYCLEARSMPDRDSFVKQLKLAVARFGSQLVANDPAVEDFFIPQNGKAMEPNF
eukprot:CAMPEP_0172461636 /NCGR_PEP_ID=MMETSP1065-20121228/41210_1 /TAXON_ID=265537 /ORGANISM="Amphiprora paludosa, Strain CCMP125" /LENGTH=426 /DNA_ID=CAMNT_0013217029 /DNA_START=24 /DNA_END=1304 /DNA_ORIENTATION=+